MRLWKHSPFSYKHWHFSVCMGPTIFVFSCFGLWILFTYFMLFLLSFCFSRKACLSLKRSFPASFLLLAAHCASIYLRMLLHLRQRRGVPDIVNFSNICPRGQDFTLSHEKVTYFISNWLHIRTILECHFALCLAWFELVGSVYNTGSGTMKKQAFR